MHPITPKSERRGLAIFGDLPRYRLYLMMLERDGWFTTQELIDAGCDLPGMKIAEQLDTLILLKALEVDKTSPSCPKCRRIEGPFWALVRETNQPPATSADSPTD